MKGKITMTKLFQNYKRAAVEFVKAEGNYLFDQDGKKYLDFSTGIGVTNLGFHPEVKAALQKQAEEIWHTPNLYLNSLQEEVADKLIGNKDYLAFFANSGAEANEAAIKIARKATGKQEIIAFVNSFHGRTFGSMSATGQDKIKTGFGDGVPHFSYAIYNDLDSVKSLVTDDTAAIMLELVQGESGVRPADKDFVTALSVFCQETGILLIVDEVQTGMGRTGKLFSFEHYGIEPDIFTLAKGLGNGVPVGAMLAKEKLGFAFSYGSHGSTFGGNKLVMSVASSVLDIMLADGFLPQAFDNGNYLQAELKKVLAGNAKVTDVRGLGYMIGIETTENLAELVEKARDKGLIVLTAGTNVIRLLPPLTLTKEEIDQGVAILAEVFA
jgi:acetylornithine/N-succinyldiaminopimelate aminotransferase